jgi:hypothetical protein
MNSIEKNVVNDTVLNAGLLFAGVLWVAMAAVSGPLPLTQPAGAGEATLMATPAVATPPAHATARTA